MSDKAERIVEVLREVFATESVVWPTVQAAIEKILAESEPDKRPEHSPLPWYALVDAQTTIRDAEDNAVAYVADCDKDFAFPGTCEFIVRACNAQDVLIEVLKAAKDFLYDQAGEGLPRISPHARLLQAIKAAEIALEAD